MMLPENFNMIINIAMAIIILVAVIIGCLNGFLWVVIKAAGLLCVFILAYFLAPGLSELVNILPKKFAPFADTSLAGIFYHKINMIIWFVIIVVIGLLILLILKPLFKSITELPIIKPINKVLGAVLSLIPAFIIMLLATLILNSALFANGKEVVDNSGLKYVEMISEKTNGIIKDTFAENIAIQKMLSDPLSLTTEDLGKIVDWLKDNQIDSSEIYNFLMKYGIDTNQINELLNKGNSNE